MSEKQSIYQKLDQEFFNLIDKLKDNENYQQFLEFLGTLEDSQFKAFKITFHLLCLIIPLVPAVFMYIQVEKQNVALKQREDIIRHLNDIIAINLDINKNAQKVLISNPNPNNSYIRQRFTSIASIIGIDTANVRVNSVETNEISEKIQETTVSFNLVNFSNDQIFEFLSQVTSKEKLILDKIDIRKNTANNLLEGNFTGYLYSQVANLNE